MGLWRVGDDWVTEQQITTSNNRATECIWVVSGEHVACHRSETQDSGKTLNVFDLEIVKQPLKCVAALKQWMLITYVFDVEWVKNHLKYVSWLKHYMFTLQMVCLISYRERSTKNMSQYWNWIMINHCAWWPAVVEKSMKVCNSTESMDGDKLRVCSTLGGQRIFWNINQN